MALSGKEGNVRLQGQVALVTRTSPNIGGGIAEGLADEEARIVRVDVLPDNTYQCTEAAETAILNGNARQLL